MDASPHILSCGEILIRMLCAMLDNISIPKENGLRSGKQSHAQQAITAPDTIEPSKGHIRFKRSDSKNFRATHVHCRLECFQGVSIEKHGFFGSAFEAVSLS